MDNITMTNKCNVCTHKFVINIDLQFILLTGTKGDT